MSNPSVNDFSRLLDAAEALVSLAHSGGATTSPCPTTPSLTFSLTSTDSGETELLTPSPLSLGPGVTQPFPYTLEHYQQELRQILSHVEYLWYAALRRIEPAIDACLAGDVEHLADALEEFWQADRAFDMLRSMLTIV